MDFRHPQIGKIIDLALEEDLGDGDHSSIASIPKGTQGESRILFKEDGVLAGLALAIEILKKIEPGAQIITIKNDGDWIDRGEIVARAKGSVHSLLAAERVILNFMQHLSGIATTTHEAVALLDAFHSRLLDTRKTTPGQRLLEKWAVKLGGAENHRMGLFDMIMLKDNHIDSAGGITTAIERATEYLKNTGKQLKIEVETRNLDEVEEALSTGVVDRIMLDNFDVDTCSMAVRFIGGRAETEASGGINLLNLQDYASTGVDFISMGYLTHSAKNTDISMKTHFTN